MISRNLREKLPNPFDVTDDLSDTTIFHLFLGDLAMNDLQKDILIGLLFITGIWTFISGQFIVSTIMFASAAIYSNIAKRPQLKS